MLLTDMCERRWMSCRCESTRGTSLSPFYPPDMVFHWDHQNAVCVRRHLNHHTGIARWALNLSFKLSGTEAGDRFSYYCMSYKWWSTRTSQFVKFISTATPLEEGRSRIHLLLFIRLEHSVSADSSLSLLLGKSWILTALLRRIVQSV